MAVSREATSLLTERFLSFLVACVLSGRGLLMIHSTRHTGSLMVICVGLALWVEFDSLRRNR